MLKSAVEKHYYEMPELVGVQTMVILDPNVMSFDTVCVFGLDFQLLFKSGSSYCVCGRKKWGILHYYKFPIGLLFLFVSFKSLEKRYTQMYCYLI